MYETFAHTADTGLRVQTADLNTLFAEAGQALFSLMVGNLDDVQTRSRVPFAIDGDDVEYLLVDWLTELLYAFESERWLFREFEVSIGAGELRATGLGETADTKRHQLEHEVKAITYHGLEVKQSPEGWNATVIVDI